MTAERDQGLSRERLVAAALELLDAEGIEGLSMRALADRLGVKAASLYWHVRDRRTLLELVAASVLAGVERPAAGTPWRAGISTLCGALDAALGARRDLAALVLEVRAVLDASGLRARLVSLLADAGLREEEAAPVASMLLATVVFGRLRVPASPASSDDHGAVGHATVLVDAASLGVTLRAGTPSGPVALVADPDGGASVVVQGRNVVVRRARGAGRADVHLDPRFAWSVRVGGATTNTRLLLGGLTVTDLKVDSGAARIEVVLPRPRGPVPIEISSGVTGVRIHRPRGTAASAHLSAGALRLRLDGSTTLATLGDTGWSAGDARAADRYELRVNSGTVDVLLDERAPAGPPASALDHAAAPSAGGADPRAAIAILLDGVEARLRRRPA